MNDFDFAYAAGLIDGEGWIGIRKKKGKRNINRPYSYAVSVAVCITNEYIVQWLQTNFKGSVYKKRKIIGRKDAWTWAVHHKLALSFLKLILPYLKIKKQQAELAIIFQENVKHRQYKYNPKTDIEFAIEERQAELMHKLNS